MAQSLANNLKEFFAEAYEITVFIADDKESPDMLTQSGKDYAGAQSSIEWAEVYLKLY